VVDKVAVGKVLLLSLRHSLVIIPTMFHTHVHLLVGHTSMT
jgi:hypothetical protein